MQYFPLFPLTALFAPGRRGLLGAGLLVALFAWLPGSPASAADAPASAPEAVQLEVFVREGCPHCAEAKVYLAQLRRERPALRMSIRDIQRDREALERLRELVAKSPGRMAGVPAFHVQGELIIGFTGTDTTGARIRELLDRPAAPAPPSVADEGNCRIEAVEPCATPVRPEGGFVELPWIGTRNSLVVSAIAASRAGAGFFSHFDKALHRNICALWRSHMSLN